LLCEPGGSLDRGGVMKQLTVITTSARARAFLLQKKKYADQTLVMAARSSHTRKTKSAADSATHRVKRNKIATKQQNSN